MKTAVTGLKYCSHNIPMISCEEHKPREKKPLETLTDVTFNNGNTLAIATVRFRLDGEQLYVQDSVVGWVPLDAEIVRKDRLIE